MSEYHYNSSGLNDVDKVNVAALWARPKGTHFKAVDGKLTKMGWLDSVWYALGWGHDRTAAEVKHVIVDLTDRLSEDQDDEFTKIFFFDRLSSLSGKVYDRSMSEGRYGALERIYWTDKESLPEAAGQLKKAYVWAALGNIRPLDDAGYNGSYIVWDGVNKTELGIFKPEMEEQNAPENPYWLPWAKSLVYRTVLKPVVGGLMHLISGQGFVAEAAAKPAGDAVMEAAMLAIDELEADKGDLVRLVHLRSAADDLEGYVKRLNKRPPGEKYLRSDELREFGIRIEDLLGSAHGLDGNRVRHDVFSGLRQEIAKEIRVEQLRIRPEADAEKSGLRKLIEDNLDIVPDTWVANLSVRWKGPMRGSFQTWITEPNKSVFMDWFGVDKQYKAVEGAEHREIPQELLEIMMVIEIILHNRDRHAENGFVIHDEEGKVTGIRLFDNGMGFPPDHDPWFAVINHGRQYPWRNLPQAQRELTPFGRALIRNLNITTGTHRAEIYKVYTEARGARVSTAKRLKSMELRVAAMKKLVQTDRPTLAQVSDLKTKGEIFKALHELQI